MFSQKDVNTGTLFEYMVIWAHFSNINYKNKL